MWPLLRRVYEVFGAERLLFSGFHELLILQDITPFFTPEDKAWVLGDTARAVYNL